MATRRFSSISVETTLASGISNSATTMTVATGTGSALIQGSGFVNGDQFTVALDPDTQNEEIVFITAISSDTFTISRGEAGTSAISHSGGASVKHVLTSDDLNAFNSAVSPVSSVTFAGSSSGTMVLQSTPIASGTVTIPAGTATLVNTSATQTLTNKDLSASSNSFPSTLVTTTATQTITNKDLTSTTNTFPTTVVTTTATQTLTNKTIDYNANTITNLPGVSFDLAFNAQTGTTYTLALSDKDKLVTLSNASPVTLTVPANSSVAFPTGAQVNIQQIGAGQVTVVGAGGVTLNGTGTVLRTQWSAATLIKTATDTWTIVGDLTV